MTRFHDCKTARAPAELFKAVARRGWLGTVIPLIMVAWGLAKLYRNTRRRIMLVTARGFRCIIVGIKLLKHMRLSDRGNSSKRLIMVCNDY